MNTPRNNVMQRTPGPTPASGREQATDRPEGPLLRAAVVLALVLAAAAGMPGCASQGPTAAEQFASQERSREEGITLARQAQAAELGGRNDEAIELYRRAVAAWPDQHAAWNNLGVLLMQREQYMEARDMFLVAADRTPADPKPYENIGHIYSQTGWEDRALEYYVKALERTPGHIPALRGAVRAAAALKLGDEESLERVRRALMADAGADPRWRRLYESEQLRISNRLRRRAIGMPEMASPAGVPGTDDPATREYSPPQPLPPYR